MPSTYEPIATTTLGSAVASVTFSSISGAYTDLVFVGAFANSANTDLYMRFNGVTSGYSVTQVYGDGSTAGSLRYTATNTFVLDPGASGLGTGQANIIANIQNYSNTTTYKNVLARVNAAGVVTGAVVGLFPSTSAITSVNLYADQNFAIGSTFTLYGIKAA